MSGQSLGDILGDALKKKEPTLVERAAARNIVVNGMGTSVPSHREAAVSVVEATFEFVPNDRERHRCSRLRQARQQRPAWLHQHRPDSGHPDG